MGMIENNNLPEKTVVGLDALPRLHKKNAEKLLTIIHLVDQYFEKVIINGRTSFRDFNFIIRHFLCSFHSKLKTHQIYKARGNRP